MNPAEVRWIRADLRARRVQALLAVLAVTGIVTALITAATLLEDGTNPWRGLFERGNGAHVWIHTKDAPDPATLRTLNGVADLAGPYRSAPATLSQEGKKTPVALRETPAVPPSVGRPLMREGRWLDPRDPRGVVVERSFARALGLRPGGPFSVVGLNGATHTLTVAGTAESGDQGFYPEWAPGLVWTLPQTLAQVEPKVARSESVTGLRLADPDATALVAQRAITKLAGQVQRVSTWHEVRASMELDNRLLGVLLGLFGAAGLVAAVLAIANATGGRILSQRRDIATLKSLGFTRRQVVRMLVVEHGSLGLLGIALGVLCGRLITVYALAETVVVPLSSAPLLGIAFGTALVVLVAVWLPAWRGGRTPPLPAAAAPPRGHLSRAARLAFLVRLPPALVLGARDAFTRRLPALLTAFGLAIPMMMITIGLGYWATLDDFRDRPEQVGQAAALTVRPGMMTSEDAHRVALADPDVVAAFPGTEVDALVPGQTRTVRARALGTVSDPYPFAVVEGRLFRDRGEAVAGQGLLDLLNVRVGDRTRLTIGGTPLIVRIVGRVLEPEQDGEVLSVALDSLAPKDAVPPQFYGLVLREGADPGAVRSRLQGEALEVSQAVSLADRLSVIRVIIVALVVVLALIGLANLLTASALGLRDHALDLAVLKAMGLTPRQVMATLVTGTGLLVVLGVGAGAAAGALVSSGLIDLQGAASGIGAGIGRAPAPLTLLLAVLVAVGAALLVALIPARKAARARIPVTPR
ncbi:FtsX-like permease family protein [Sphaerisporangium sp. TRM90804]|uniref:ABC transporter permease n=1 Tax=Sphaerisporangium sp. TRM90804 TaxID=3031113 RepID=UPI00244A113C|nr:FtsX-like permease family protein [Sphaerisporangium sp. TRM90804]MDH2428094.1 FtsX-like permease family protein [Sphaerisporangium sp. TRM90804]